MEIQDIQNKIAPILRENGIKEAKIFGSVSRGEDLSESDVDLLVSLGRPMGMFAFMRFVNSLEEVLGKKVDVVTDQSINRHIRPYVYKEAKLIYES